MKIAHLILAHHNPTQLARLVDKLSHPEADIYIHLDGKADISLFRSIFEKPQVYPVKTRTKVYWGSYSIVQATINSFAQILAANKSYSHINLLSGNDYPVKSIAHIHQFLGENPNQIFMEYLKEDSEWWQKVKTRVTHYHLTDFHFPGCYQVQVILNKILPLRKLPKGLILVGRSQWLTITSEGAKYVIDYLTANPHIRRFFRFTWGSDEIAIQSILYNSHLREKIVNDNYRYIDWSEHKSSPKTLTMADAGTMIHSTCLFARKFELQTDPEVLDYLDITFP